MQVSGSLQRQRAADELVHSTFTADTRDHEDHTFAGIMFDVQARNSMPIEYIEIQAVSVRGDLGPLTIWTTPDSFKSRHESKQLWSLVYNKVQPSSKGQLCDLQLDIPVRLIPGQSCGLYVHSSTPGDDQIVYDNQRNDITHQDDFLEILPGMAHLCNQPFSRFSETDSHYWWGSPWRPRREFVGRLSYGIRWLLWNPEVHHQLPPRFREMVWALFMSRHPRAHCSRVSDLQLDLLLFILNKVEWWNMGEANCVEWKPPGAVNDPPKQPMAVHLHPYLNIQWQEYQYEESASGESDGEAEGCQAGGEDDDEGDAMEAGDGESWNSADKYGAGDHCQVDA